MLCAWVCGVAQDPLPAEPPGLEAIVPAQEEGMPASEGAETVPDSAGALPEPAPVPQDPPPPPKLHPKTWRLGTFDLYEIPERRLTNDLWRYAELPGDPEDGSYQGLLFTDSVPHAYLLLAGTQVSRLPDTALPYLRQKIRSGELSRGGGANLWRNFWNPRDPVQPFLWKTGLEADVRHAVTAMPRSSPQMEQHYNITFSQRPETWLAMEVGGHMSRYGGGLRRNLKNPRDTAPNWTHWDELRPWWHAAIGIPGLKWEVSLANRLFPDYYWLDPHGGEGSYKAGRAYAGAPVDPNDTSEVFQDGTLMRGWSQDGNPFPSSRNLAHTLHAKMGIIRYSAHFDRDVYRSVIHRVLFDELSAPFGQWGFGFVSATGAAHTLLRLDLFPWRFGFGRAAEHASVRLMFLRLDFAYRDLQTFHVGATTGFLLDSRAFRPGDKP